MVQMAVWQVRLLGLPKLRLGGDVIRFIRKFGANFLID